jgi:hypothetical protein
VTVPTVPEAIAGEFEDESKVRVQPGHRIQFSAGACAFELRYEQVLFAAMRDAKSCFRDEARAGEFAAKRNSEFGAFAAERVTEQHAAIAPAFGEDAVLVPWRVSAAMGGHVCEFGSCAQGGQSGQAREASADRESGDAEEGTAGIIETVFTE